MLCAGSYKSFRIRGNKRWAWSCVLGGHHYQHGSSYYLEAQVSSRPLPPGGPCCSEEAPEVHCAGLRAATASPHPRPPKCGTSSVQTPTRHLAQEVGREWAKLPALRPSVLVFPPYLHAFSPGFSHDAPFCASASQVPEDSL